MLFKDTYITITKNTEASFNEKGSRFLSFVFPVHSTDDTKKNLQQLKLKHPSANHHCYAFVLGFNQEYQKSSDDGEPNNTAGRPILRALLSHQLTNTMVVVVRYFGGKLLGVPGLIEAYGQAANHVCNKAEKVEKLILEQYQLTLPLNQENEAFRVFKNLDAKVLEILYGEVISITFEIRKSMASKVLAALSNNPGFKTIFVTER